MLIMRVHKRYLLKELLETMLQKGGNDPTRMEDKMVTQQSGQDLNLNKF